MSFIVLGAYTEVRGEDVITDVEERFRPEVQATFRDPRVAKSETQKGWVGTEVFEMRDHLLQLE